MESTAKSPSEILKPPMLGRHFLSREERSTSTRSLVFACLSLTALGGCASGMSRDEFETNMARIETQILACDFPSAEKLIQTLEASDQVERSTISDLYRTFYLKRSIEKRKQENYEGSIADMIKAVGEDPSDPDDRIKFSVIYIDWASTLQKRGNLAEAHNKLIVALTYHPKSERARQQLAELFLHRAQQCFENGDLRGAISMLEAAVSFNVKFPNIHQVIGDTYYKLAHRKLIKHDVDGAIQALEKALEYDIGNTNYIRNVMKLRMHRATNKFNKHSVDAAREDFLATHNSTSALFVNG